MSHGTVNFTSQFTVLSAFSHDLYMNLCFLFFLHYPFSVHGSHNFIFVQSSTYLTTFFAPVALVTASLQLLWSPHLLLQAGSSLDVIDCLSYTLSFCSPGLLVAGINHAHNGSVVLPFLNLPLGWICEETANASSPAKRTLTTCILVLQISQGIISGSRLGHILSIEPYTSPLDVPLCYRACLPNRTRYPHHHRLVGVEAQLVQEWCFGDMAPAV